MGRWVWSAALLLALAGCGLQAPQPLPSPPPRAAAAEAAPEAEEKIPPGEAAAPEESFSPEDFVRAADHLPGLRVDLRYAGEDNFTGTAIYDFTDACLRFGTVQKLAKAQEALAEQGYSLLVWDAFRPTQAQFLLWQACPDPVYVANPQQGFSSHSRGNTVDVTLTTLEGEAVEMPTGFDDFTALADRDYSDVPEPAASHARLLEQVMTDCGFRPYSGEWWHFTDTDDYPVEETFTP